MNSDKSDYVIQHSGTKKLEKTTKRLSNNNVRMTQVPM